MNPYHVGVGGFLVVSFYVLILSFLWRAAAAKLATSSNPTTVAIGGGMAAIL